MITPRTDWTITVATFGGLGQKLPAPGTIGSLLGIGWYFVAFYPLNNILGQILLAAFTIALAVKITEHAAEHLHTKDPSAIILDEIVAMPIIFIGLTPFLTTQPLLTLGAGFIVFRILDILKPFGLKRLQVLPGGLGIVLDDVVAALLTVFILLAIFLIV